MPTAHAMLTPVYDQQALGLVIGGAPSRRYFNHGGSNAGYRCYLVACEDGDGAIVMTNSDSGDALIGQSVRTIAREYGWPDFQPPERSLAPLDAQSFDHYAGACRLRSGDTVTFWRDGSRIKSRIWGQQVVELFPTSDREYFAQLVDARWIFSEAADAPNITATLYQNGQEHRVTRLEGVEGQIALETSIGAEVRFREQKPSAASESALRRLIAGLADGNPDYAAMSPGLAAHTPRARSAPPAPCQIRLAQVHCFQRRGGGRR